MRDRATSKKEQKPKFDPTKWMHEHPKFVIWWKEHSHSGFAERERDHKQAWLITPWQAWDMERYRAEFTLESTDPTINAKIPEWLAEEQKAKAMTTQLEKQLGKEFWKKPAEETFGRAGQIYREFMKTKSEFTAKAMQAKIDEAYAGPYLSEEEQEALRRRREDDETRD